MTEITRFVTKQKTNHRQSDWKRSSLRAEWTAYDMLKELEKSGLPAREYVVHHGAPGRSQLVYVPTEQAYGMIDSIVFGLLCFLEFLGKGQTYARSRRL